jgi:hypothetical protein
MTEKLAPLNRRRFLSFLNVTEKMVKMWVVPTHPTDEIYVL